MLQVLMLQVLKKLELPKRWMNRLMIHYVNVV